ncbi:MAG: polyribonucleotide nucleotidyltransferase [Thiotrichales bacterium]|nr:MAG: polyribonucleotide nucleotidyltransferase [Thiotrichales bacterium]
MKIYKKTFTYGKHTVTIETGGVARQANGAVFVSIGDTKVLVTVTMKEDAKQNCNFVPMGVHYQEKGYASGRIPTIFTKRETKASTNETLTSRLIDRAVRPLLPKEFHHEMQIVAQVVSLDPEISGDIAAFIGASAALKLAGAPMSATIGAVKVGYINKEFVVNPNYKELLESDLELVVAGTKESVLMVESEAKELTEETMLDAVMFGHGQLQAVISAIEELAAVAAKPVMEWDQPKACDSKVIELVKAFLEKPLQEAYKFTDKAERQKALKALKKELQQHVADASDDSVDTKAQEADVSKEFAKLEKNFVRSNILKGKLRIDNRDTKTVRPINIMLDALPRAHGSSIFTRGETQALVSVTLGTGSEAPYHEYPRNTEKDHFLLHYNFLPFCVGEVGMMGGPKRREIGHGVLARRALNPVMPAMEDFPYTVRIVSEITESNGSSSMATVCGGSLSLMAAGVPIKRPVAGIAMGLIKEGESFAVLSDILGDEDHLGDMDFKVAGTLQGITALQMDIKIGGIGKEIMKTALAQALEGRVHILGLMTETIATTRDALSEHAPKVNIFKIPTTKIKDVIGKGGATIRSIIEKTGVSIDLNEDGTVQIFSTSQEGLDEASTIVKDITADVEIGKIYNGTVTKLADFGAFVNVLPKKDGLVHISQITGERINRISDVLQVGQEVRVKVLDVDHGGKIKLSIKDVPQEEGTADAPSETETTEKESTDVK